MKFGDVFDNMGSLLPALAPFHLFAYSTLLGTELYQSFVMTGVCYRSLPRTAFISLQKIIFPIYFQGQTLLLIVIAITTPPKGLLTLVESKWDFLPFLIAGVTAGLNLTLYGPSTRQTMIDRVHQGEPEQSAVSLLEYEGFHLIRSIAGTSDTLKRAFARNHAMSIHLNLITIGATLWYGWRLASRLKVEIE